MLEYIKIILKSLFYFFDASIIDYKNFREAII